MAAASSFKRQTMTVLAVIVLSAVALFLLWPASQIFLVTFSAILFAILVDGMAKLITRRIPAPQIVARIGVIVLMLVVLIVFLIIAGPRFSDQISQLSEQLPLAIERLTRVITEHPWSDFLDNLNMETLKPTEAQILAGVTGVFSTAFEAIAVFIVTFFIGVYLAVQPEIYISGLLHLIPKTHRERGHQILNKLGHAMGLWLVGRFASMAIVGVMTTLALELIDMPLALVLGVIAGLFCFVPYVGPIISAVPAILIGLMESPLMALYVTLIYMLIQFIEGNFLTPLILTRAVSLPPAMLLLAQFAMGIFYGLFGVLLATPLAIVLIVLIQMLYVQDVIKDPIRVLGEHGGKPQ